MKNVKFIKTALLACSAAACALPAGAAIPASERAVLDALYAGTHGAGWSRQDGWGGGAGTECAWSGITCDAAEQHVIEIDLASNRLAGTLPDLAGLTALQYFNVYNNELTGPIPALAPLRALRGFMVGGNRLTGSMPSLAGLTELKGLWVFDNRLSGPMPSLAGLTALQRFSAAGNRLGGTIPALAGLPALQRFSVSNNRLVGALPDLAGLTALREFRVGGNQLTGTPPPAPPALVAGGSRLGPNFLHQPSPTDAAWNAAVGGTWSAGSVPGYLVRTRSSQGGAIDPARAVPAGASTTITVTADAGYVIDHVDGSCEGTLAGQTYTTQAVTAECTVAAHFKAR